jgi:hypothetical protein
MLMKIVLECFVLNAGLKEVSCNDHSVRAGCDAGPVLTVLCSKEREGVLQLEAACTP